MGDRPRCGSCSQHERIEHLQGLLRTWLTGSCPNYSEGCRERFLCELCFENAVIDFDLDEPPTRAVASHEGAQHAFIGRLDRGCEVCGQPDRHGWHDRWRESLPKGERTATSARRNMMDVSPFDPDYTPHFCTSCGSVEETYNDYCYYCWFAKNGDCPICARPADWHPCDHMIEHGMGASR